jgi:hypothetical protein
MAFRVWIQSQASVSRIRVEGSHNALWLLDRLSRSFIFKSSQPVFEDRVACCSIFDVPHTSQIPRHALERLLAAIPEVTLLPEAA